MEIARQLRDALRAGRPRSPSARRTWFGVVMVAISLLVVGSAWMHLGGGMGSRITAANGGIGPLSYLGSEFDETGCVRTPLTIGEGYFVLCGDFTANTSRSGVARVISVYGPGNPVPDEYTGALPRALQWGQTPKGVLKALGRPSRISDLYGPPTLIYTCVGEPYGSLELQFDIHDHLARINACLTR